MMTKKISTENLVERLNEISSWVSSSQDLEQLLELILETATGILNAKAGSILLLESRTQNLVFKAATGEKKQQLKSFTIKLGQGIAGHVAQTGEPILGGYFFGRHTRFPFRANPGGLSPESVIPIFPLVGLGCISFFSAGCHDEFNIVKYHSILRFRHDHRHKTLKNIAFFYMYKIVHSSEICNQLLLVGKL